jgi:SAM-dependent methyltransferase
MEIASNDGYLLQFFQQKGIPCIGVEPSKGAARFAIDKGIETITEFFNESFAKDFVSQRYSLDLILGNNVLAHVPDLDSFLKGVCIGLGPQGVATFEFPHILNLIAKTQFDTVYHEHFSYFSLYAIRDIAGRYGLRVFDVEKVSTHGGSLRIYLCRQESGHPLLPQVEAVLAEEEAAGLMKLETYTGFQAQVDHLKYDMLETLIRLKREGAVVAGYGAAAKGSTTFNYCGIRPDLVQFVCDRAPSKVNKYLPGCHVPIVPEEHLKAVKPDYVIIVPWNIRTEISNQLSYIREWGGKFITLVPQVEIF